jgi:uncharacterized protein YfiM (DUF2279 family)
MFLTSSKLRLAAVGIAALAVLSGTTALAASHQAAAAPKAAAQSEVAGEKDQQDAKQESGPARTATNAADAAKISNFEGEFQGQQ